MIDPGTLEHKYTHLHTSTHPSCISCGSGWRIHCCSVEVTELSTNKQHTLSQRDPEMIPGVDIAAKVSNDFSFMKRSRDTNQARDM
jgi:hypothetical protein